jgi:uncharacterized Tic20 family protein
MTDPTSSRPEAGWYPDPEGRTRWWDGRAWGPLAPTAGPTTGPTAAESRNLALLAQLLGIFTGFLGPLIVYLVNARKDAFVRHHASEALNFQITYFIAVVVSVLSMLVLVGFVLVPVVFVAGLVFEIQAAIAASRGEWWRFPVCIRVAPGEYGG